MGKKGKKKSSNPCMFLKDADIFGYQVELKYKDDKNKMQSILGGIISIMVLGIILV